MYGSIPSLSHTPQLKTRETTVAEKEWKPDTFPTLQLIPENKWFKRKYMRNFPACIPVGKKKTTVAPVWRTLAQKLS
jgi:hypothetical protein